MTLEERIKALEDMHQTGDEHGHPDRTQAGMAAAEAIAEAKESYG